MSTLDNILKFIEIKKISIRQFEKGAGLANGTIVGTKKRGSELSYENIKKVVETYSKQFGELGYASIQMEAFGRKGWEIIFAPDNNENGQKEKSPSKLIPYYNDVHVTAGKLESYNESRPVATYVNLGDAFNDATGALHVSGHSMFPTFENGCIVGYREVVDKSYFLYGEIYIIGTEDYQMIKRVQQSKIKGNILLASDNDEIRKDGSRKFEYFEIEIDKVKFLALILGKISRLQMKLIKSNGLQTA